MDTDWTSLDFVLEDSPPKNSSKTPQPDLVVELGDADGAAEPAMVGVILVDSDVTVLRAVSISRHLDVLEDLRMRFDGINDRLDLLLIAVATQSFGDAHQLRLDIVSVQNAHLGPDGPDQKGQGRVLC